MGDFSAQDLANTAWAFATARQRRAPLFAALARAGDWRLGDSSAQGLANTAWAFATAGQRDALLFAVLARTAERCLGGFSAQELANTAWAFATASQRDAPLFVALARAAERRLADLSAQGLADTAWTFAKWASLMRRFFCGVGPGGGAAPGKLQRAGSRQYVLGVCDGALARCAVIRGFGDGNRAACG